MRASRGRSGTWRVSDPSLGAILFPPPPPHFAKFVQDIVELLFAFGFLIRRFPSVRLRTPALLHFVNKHIYTPAFCGGLLRQKIIQRIRVPQSRIFLSVERDLNDTFTPYTALEQMRLEEIEQKKALPAAADAGENLDKTDSAVNRTIPFLGGYPHKNVINFQPPAFASRLGATMKSGGGNWPGTTKRRRYPKPYYLPTAVAVPAEEPLEL